MSFLTLSKLTAAAAAAGAEPGNLTVVFTGLSLVFLILLILIVVILIQGKIFTSLAGRKGEKAPAATVPFTQFGRLQAVIPSDVVHFREHY